MGDETGLVRISVDQQRDSGRRHRPDEGKSSKFNLARYLETPKNIYAVVLNHTNLRTFLDSQKKNDKTDAMKVVCIARDMRPPEAWPSVAVPSEQKQSERTVITHWALLREQEAMLCNRFFDLVNSLGYPEIYKSRKKKDSNIRVWTIYYLLSFNELAVFLFQLTGHL